MARVVDVADQLANANGRGLRRSEEADISQSESAICLNLTVEQLASIWEKSEAAVQEVAHLLG